MKTIIAAIIMMVAISATTYAQSQQGQSADVQAVSSEAIQSALEDWKQWHAEPTAQNAYVEEFMKAYDVPQKGMQNLSREETWYWWISHHSEELETYFEMKQEAGN